MRLEAGVKIGLDEDARPVAAEHVVIRLREDTPQSTGGCETCITLSIEEADRLAMSLLQFIHYTVDELRGGK